MIISKLFSYCNLMSRCYVIILEIIKIFENNQQQKKEEKSIQNNKNQTMNNIEEIYENKMKRKKEKERDLRNNTKVLSIISKQCNII